METSRRFRTIYALAMALVVLGWTWVWHAVTERVVVESAPPVAVAGLVMPAGEQDQRIDFMRQLTASLARIRGFTVTPMAELYGAAAGDSTAAGLVLAARRLEIPEVIQGSLLRAGAGYRLELQRLDAHTRTELGTVSAEGATHADVIREITAQVAMSLGLAVPPTSP